MTLCLLRITKLLSSIDFVCQQQRRTRHLDIDRFAYPHALIAAYLSSSSSIAFRAFCKIWLGGAHWNTLHKSVLRRRTGGDGDRSQTEEKRSERERELAVRGASPPSSPPPPPTTTTHSSAAAHGSKLPSSPSSSRRRRRRSTPPPPPPPLV